MARGKKNNEEAMQARLQNSVEIAEQLGLHSASYDIKTKARIILEAADKIQEQICAAADSIKIEGFEQAKEILGDTVMLTKPFFLELVDIRRKAIFDQSPEWNENKDKQLPKIEEGTKWTATMDATRKKVYEDIAEHNGRITKLLSNDAEIDVNEANLPMIDAPEEFLELLDDCAATRQRINTELWPQMAKYHDCFTVECEAEDWEFHDIMRWWHYRKGGYPTEGSKPYLWAILDKFQYAFRQCNKYGLDFCDSYLERFGLDVQISGPVQDNAYEWDL